jgi:hypothetical protein
MSSFHIFRIKKVGTRMALLESLEEVDGKTDATIHLNPHQCVDPSSTFKNPLDIGLEGPEISL